MTTRKALSTKNVPKKIPVTNLIIWWLLLDRLNASPLVWGVVGTLLVIIFLLCVADYFLAKEIEIG